MTVQELKKRYATIKNICMIRASRQYAAGCKRPDRQEWERKYATYGEK